MNSGKTGKYLKYAIGEVILVVIGILIALSINNWNENRKDRLLEQELLSNLISTLEQNSEVLKDRIRRIDYYKYSGDLFINAIETKQAYHDSLGLYFHRALMNTSQIEISRLGYEMLKNAGLELIQNDSLKQGIIRFFEDVQPEFLRNLSWGEIDIENREHFIDEQFKQGYDDTRQRPIYKPFNPETILQNNYFIALIFKTNNQRGYFVQKMKQHKEKNDKLLEMLKQQ